VSNYCPCCERTARERDDVVATLTATEYSYKAAIAECDSARVQLRATDDTIATLRIEVARLQEVLRKVEWGGWDTLTGPECPDCGGAKSLGHDPSCRLAGALKEGT
jgi:hypothetical protein